VQIRPTYAQRMIHALTRARTVAVERDAETLNPNSRHRISPPAPVASCLSPIAPEPEATV
jgi:hypothetical protein